MNDEPIRETAEQRASRYMDARDAALQEAERLRGLKVMSDLVIEGLHAKVADRNDEVDELTAEVASLRAALREIRDTKTWCYTAENTGKGFNARCSWSLSEMDAIARVALDGPADALDDDTVAALREAGGPEYEQVGWLQEHAGYLGRKFPAGFLEHPEYAADPIEPVFRKVTPEATAEEEA